MSCRACSMACQSEVPSYSGCALQAVASARRARLNPLLPATLVAASRLASAGVMLSLAVAAAAAFHAPSTWRLSPRLLALVPALLAGSLLSARGPAARTVQGWLNFRQGFQQYAFVPAGAARPPIPSHSQQTGLAAGSAQTPSGAEQWGGSAGRKDEVRSPTADDDAVAQQQELADSSSDRVGPGPDAHEEGAAARPGRRRRGAGFQDINAPGQRGGNIQPSALLRSGHGKWAGLQCQPRSCRRQMNRSMPLWIRPVPATVQTPLKACSVCLA